MLSDFKKFVNFNYQRLKILETVYSEDEKEINIKCKNLIKTIENFNLKLIDQKIFKNNKEKNYKVIFIKEQLIENPEYSNLIAFIELENENFVCLNYDYYNDKYMITGLQGYYIFGDDNDQGGLSETLRKELKDIYNQLIDYIDKYNKKQIKRLLNTKEKESSISYIKKFL